MNTTRENPSIDLSDKASRLMDASRERATEAIETTRTWIVENPAAAIGLAVSAGFLVGRVVRR